jgi:hypothetical protein
MGYRSKHNCLTHTHKYVGLSRIELLTSRLSGVRSNHLSYRPKLNFLDIKKSFYYFNKMIFWPEHQY